MEQLEVIKITEDAKSLIILDQTQLPNHEEYLTLQTKEEMWKAIKLLQVRGAPAIGVFAGYAMAVLAQHYPYDSYDAFKEAFDQDADYLNTSRPTAVNLSWALNRMKAFVETNVIDVAAIKVKLESKNCRIWCHTIKGWRWHLDTLQCRILGMSWLRYRNSTNVSCT